MNYVNQTSVPDYILVEKPEYAERAINGIKREHAIALFDEIYKSKTPVILDIHLEKWRSEKRETVFRLHSRLTHVQQQEIVIPVFTFTNHLGILEWKCPACGIINQISATYCGEKHERAVGCGRPRENINESL